ncbi:hypothetical protein CsSME_00005077 [Camellia sinensis var. sinensis]
MGLKPMLFLLAFLLLVTTRVSSNDEEFLTEPPAHSPVKAPALAHVPVKAPAPILPIKPPVLPPSPVQAPPTNFLPKTKQECVPLCEERCKLHSRKRVCVRVCMTCCDRCRCVPPGTNGNREKCGKCYTDMTTHGGKSKCP